MNWIWIGGGGLFVVAGISVFIAFQRPEFVMRFFKSAAWGIFNSLMPILLKRMTPEDEAKWHQAIRQAQEWDFARKRPREKH